MTEDDEESLVRALRRAFKGPLCPGEFPERIVLNSGQWKRFQERGLIEREKKADDINASNPSGTGDTKPQKANQKS